MQTRIPKLDVYLRTHTGANVHPGERFIPFGKDTLVVGCVRSLVRSLVAAKTVVDATLTIVDDHSVQTAVDSLVHIARASGLTWKLIQLPPEETGNSASLRAAYRVARETARELVYFVEDDYLHEESAIAEMVLSREMFARHLGQSEVGISPVDYPDNYGRLFEECRIVAGNSRHFRTVRHSTGTLLIPKTLFMKNWDLFASLGLYGLIPEISETSSINRIWLAPDAFLFAPVPTLAIHMQFKENIPPYVHWEKWWERYAVDNTRATVPK